MNKNWILFGMSLFLSTHCKAQMDARFYYPGKNMLPVNGLQYEEVILPVDSEQVSGLFIKPAGVPRATILFLHGNGGNVTRYLYMIRPLIKEGFQVFMVDFRGYGRSTGIPSHLNIAHDGQLVLNYLLARKDVRDTKILIYGASIGTQEAVHLAKDNQAEITALVLEGTISSFTDIAEDHSPPVRKPAIRQLLISPYAAKDDIRSIVYMPLLFIHSEEDTDVPLAEAELVYRNAPEPKTFILFKGKHLDAMKVEPEIIVQAIDRLLKIQKN